MYAIRTTDITKAVPVIREGRIVAFPTGTSYGFGVDALQGHALQRLRNIKKRPHDKTFTVCMHEGLWKKYLDLSSSEKAFLSRYANTALTLLVHPTNKLAHLEQDGFIGLRVVDHPIMQSFVELLDVPITATSANISGEEPCYTPDDIEQKFPGRDGTTYDLSLGCILDAGPLQKGTQSTIAKLEHGNLQIIRQGSLILASNTSG